MSQIEKILFGDSGPEPPRGRHSSCNSPSRASRASRWRARRWPSGRPSRWPSSTCACPRDGTASRPSSISGGRSGRAGRRLLGALGLRLGGLLRAARPLGQTAGAEEALRAHRGAAVRQRADAQVAGRAGAAPPGPVARTHGHGAHRGSRSRQRSAAPSRHARCAHRASQSRAARRPPRPGHRARRARSPAVRRARARPGSLQVRQRFARPSRRRRAAESQSRGGCAAWSAKIDTVARVGGDEFVLLLGADLRQAGRGAGRATRRSRRCRSPLTIAGVDLHVSTSVGIAFYPPMAARRRESARARRRGDVLREAARPEQPAVFRARHGHHHARPRASSRATCTHALARSQFELHYQPKVDTATDNLHSAEALIRWHHPERGLILPDDFIPLAEECGLIAPSASGCCAKPAGSARPGSAKDCRRCASR